MFTGFRGETLFSQRDREEKERKKNENLKILKEPKISKNSKPSDDGVPKILGILSKIYDSVPTAQTNTTKSNTVANAPEIQVILFFLIFYVKLNYD